MTKKFESEVHLGLLGILCILLSLNFVSNYALNRTRTALSGEVSDRLNNAAVATTRQLSQPNQNYPLKVPAHIRSAYQLKSAAIISVHQLGSDDLSAETVDADGKVLATSTQLVSARLRQVIGKGLVNWNENDFLLAERVVIDGQPYCFVAVTEHRILGMLLSVANVIFYAGIAGIILTALTYLFVSRTILRPFQQLREQARAAGRRVPSGDDDVAALVAEYRHVIDELKAHQEELTRLHAAASSRAESLESFNSYLVDSIAAGVLVLDDQRDIISANRAAGRLLVWPETSSLTDDQFTACRLEQFAELNDVIEEVWKSGVAVPYRELRRGNTAGAQVVGVSVSFLRVEGDASRSMVVILHDLTELSRLRSEVELRDRLSSLGEMAAGLAHQLRNALGAIRGFATLLKRQAGSSAAPLNAEQLDALLAESEQAGALIGRFLTYAKPLHLRVDSFNLSDALAAVASSIRSRHADRSIRLDLQAEPNLIMTADQTLLRQVIENLVENAIEASRATDRPISIIARQEGEMIRLLVRDHGIGIAPQRIGSLFTPFVSSRADGTGLGLSIVKKIVDLHHGTIRVNSTPGEGTLFEVLLPKSPSKSVIFA